MQVNLDKIDMHHEIQVGDVLVVIHKGMGQTEAFLIAKPPVSDCGFIALSLEDGRSLLNGEFYTIEALIEDVRTCELFDRIMFLNREEYMLSIERI